VPCFSALAEELGRQLAAGEVEPWLRSYDGDSCFSRDFIVALFAFLNDCLDTLRSRGMLQ
jgi:hypothetical protein